MLLTPKGSQLSKWRRTDLVQQPVGVFSAWGSGILLRQAQRQWYTKGKSENEGFYSFTSLLVCVISPVSGRNLYQKLLKTSLTIYQ